MPTTPATNSEPTRAGGALDFVRLARPHHWVKSAFVLIGPFYGLTNQVGTVPEFFGDFWPALVAAASFALAASGCYVFNDIVDAPLDRQHPRKRKRPIAAGRIAPPSAALFGVVLLLAAAALLLFIPAPQRTWTALAVGAYVTNVLLYSAWLKKALITDVMCLSIGFVIRVVGGCAAVGVTPSSWLLSCTLFLAMFLSFGKRLGERRTMGDAAGSVRDVLGAYTDDLLRIAVAVTGVATLLSYTFYVEDQSGRYTLGFNLLWLTVLPATYVLLRCIVLLESGRYDDPTELALKDRGFQAGALVFLAITVGLMTSAEPAGADDGRAAQAIGLGVRDGGGPAWEHLEKPFFFPAHRQEPTPAT